MPQKFFMRIALLIMLAITIIPTPANAKLWVKFCNRNDYGMYWTFIASYGHGMWSKGIYYIPADSCEWHKRAIGASSVKFAFISANENDKEPRYYKFNLQGKQMDMKRAAHVELCIPNQTENFDYENKFYMKKFYYEIDEEKEYQDRKVVSCPEGFSVAEISSGVMLQGEVHLKLFIPKIENPTSYPLYSPQTSPVAEPKQSPEPAPEPKPETKPETKPEISKLPTPPSIQRKNIETIPQNTSPITLIRAREPVKSEAPSKAEEMTDEEKLMDAQRRFNQQIFGR